MSSHRIKCLSLYTKWRENLKTSHSVKRIYDRFSSFYDLVFKPYLEFGRPRAIELLAPETGSRVLEIGVGTGLYFEHYPSNVEVLGFDYSLGMLKEAKIKSRKLARCPVDLMQMDAQKMAFADNSFDYILAAYVMTVIPDPDKAIQELLRVAKPGGKVVLVNYIRSENPMMGFLEDISHPIFASLGLFTLNHDIPGLLKNNGVQNIQIEPTSFLKLHFIVSFTVPPR